MKRTIIPRGILTLGLTVVIFATTASSAGAVVTLDPSSVDFGNRQVGTTSPPQAHTLNLRCNRFQGFNLCAITGPTSFSPDIATTGDFAATEDCPPTLTTSNATTGVSCTINTTFTPTSTGPKEGILSTGGPEATLTGTGVTTPQPPNPPEPGEPPTLTLDLDAKKQELKKKVKFFAEASEDATMAVGGGVKVTERELVGGERRKVKAKPTNRGKLVNKLATTGRAKVKVQAEATSESGATDRDKVTIKLRD
jgi:hypothetical protein